MIRRLLKKAIGRIHKNEEVQPPTRQEYVIPEEEDEEEGPNIEVEDEDLTKWVSENKDFLLIDIRERYELEQGYLTGAWLIPMNDIPNRIQHLPKDRSLVIYCAAGMRSFGVAHYLREQGFEDSWSLAGGAGAWASQGWTFPEEGPFRIGATLSYQDPHSQTQKTGIVQHIEKNDSGPSYTLGVFEQGTMRHITDLAPESLSLSDE